MKKTYVNNLFLLYEDMRKRVDSKPSTMLVTSIGIGLAYIVAFAINIVGHEWTRVSIIMGCLLLVSAGFSLIYYISAKMERSRKVYPITLCINFTFLIIYLNLIDFMWAYAYACEGEWGYFIPVVLYKIIIVVWIVFRIYKLRKKIKVNADEAEGIPILGILALLGVTAPISTYAARRAHRTMNDFTIPYMGLIIMLLTMVMTHYWLCSFVYCKIALFGIKEKI